MSIARLLEILDIHFDTRWGTPYWLEKLSTLGFVPQREVRDERDLALFPEVSRRDLAERPVTDFIPKRFRKDLSNFISCETGGTTGPPARTAFRRDEFDAAFIAPFLHAARLMDFPQGRNWLFIGPSGPHPIGKAAAACAMASGSMDPFSVDFDPRWFRKLAAGSMSRQRYFEHIMDQSNAIMKSQDIGVLFATPPVLRALGECLEPGLRENITGVHIGGMAADRDFWNSLSEEWFPNARILSGYGNSLAGMCPQVETKAGAPPEYFPHGLRLIMDVCQSEATGRGMVVFHRLDESAFLPNMKERDEACTVEPPEAARKSGFVRPGLLDPCPPAAASETSGGLY